MIRGRKQRAYLLLCIIFTCMLVLALLLYALRQNLNFFYTPAQLYSAIPIPHSRIRIGGMVKEQSVKHLDGVTVEFMVTDFERELLVKYSGVLPDLFREGQGVVAIGTISPDNIFNAEQILAKHDEKYMPPELYK